MLSFEITESFPAINFILRPEGLVGLHPKQNVSMVLMRGLKSSLVSNVLSMGFFPFLCLGWFVIILKVHILTQDFAVHQTDLVLLKGIGKCRGFNRPFLRPA